VTTTSCNDQRRTVPCPDLGCPTAFIFFRSPSAAISQHPKSGVCHASGNASLLFRCKLVSEEENGVLVVRENVRNVWHRNASMPRVKELMTPRVHYRLAQIPWQAGKCVIWEDRVTTTPAVTYLPASCHVINRWIRHCGRSRPSGAEIPADSSRPQCHSAGFRNAQTNNSKGRLFNQLDRRRLSLIALATSVKQRSYFSVFFLTIQRFNAVCFNRSYYFNNAHLDS